MKRAAARGELGDTRLAAARSPFIAACFLSFNSAATIANAVASVRPYVDEVVVYDTGSRDETLSVLDALAETNGAPVRVHVAGAELDAALFFEDGSLRDLAFAREVAFELASPEADWLLWLDSDDEIAVGCNLHELIAREPDEVDAYVALYETGHDEQGRCRGAIWRERLVRRGRLRWRYPVHAVLEPPEEIAARYDVRSRWRHLEPDTLRVLHRGDSDRDARKTRILRELEQEADRAGVELDARTLWYLGDDVKDDDPEQALGYFVRAALNLDDSHSRWAFREIAVLRDRDDYWPALLIDGLAAQMWGSVPSMIGTAESLAGLGYLERADEILAEAATLVEAEPMVLNDAGMSAPEALRRIARRRERMSATEAA